jgi:hypothetical protein
MSIPDNFGGVLKELNNYAKQTVKFYPDRLGTVNPTDTIRMTFPKGSLVDIRSLNMYYKGTAVGVGANTEYQNRFFPRNSASVIATLALYLNGQQIERIDRYSHIYNKLWDYACSLENNHTAKNALQNTDPSVKTSIAANGTITSYITNKDHSADISDTARQFCVSNWLGFLGTSSIEFLDLSILGDLTIEIRFEPASILWKSEQPTTGAVVAPAAQNYSLSDIFFTVNRITFMNDTYLALQNSKLTSEGGIPIAFKSYIHQSTDATTAAKTINYSFSVNAQRLNKLWLTCIPSDYTTENLLQLTPDSTFLQALTTQTQAQTTRDLFNQSYYFKKDGNGISTSLVEINNIATTPYPLTMPEIFNANMEALNLKEDMNNGLHAGCYDLNSWKKFYFDHIVSLEHRQNSNDFWLMGYDGRNASINVKWTTVPEAGAAGQVYPTVFCEITKLIQVNYGQQITVVY